MWKRPPHDPYILCKGVYHTLFLGRNKPFSYLCKPNISRPMFDLRISRAVANLATLSELCIPFVKNGGYFIAYKGPGVYEELEAAEKSIKTLGGEVVSVLDAGYRSEYDHKLLIIRKIKNTSSKYPRKPGEPLKNPIK